jgi:hypothetical protein
MNANRPPYRSTLARQLRIGLALWFGLVGLSPALSLADTPAGEPQIEPPGPATGEPPVVANDAVAITDAVQIKGILDDLTIFGRYVDGENWIEYHLTDGRTAYWEKGCTYPGKWWLQQGQVCYAYPNYHDGAPNCFVLYRRPSGEIQFVAIADAGFSYLASFSLKTEMGNAAALPVGTVSPCVGA